MSLRSPDPDLFLQALEEARAGSIEALGRLLIGCRDYLLCVAHQKLEPDLQVKVSPSDVVQETFLEAQRDFRCFQGARDDELRAWLCRILVNNLANASRSYRATERRALDREVPLAGPDSDGPPRGDLAANGESPSEQAMAREQREALARAVARLPGHYQRVLRLRYEQQLSFGRIGEVMNCSAEAARKVWARAVDQLERVMNSSHETRRIRPAGRGTGPEDGRIG